MIINGRKTSYGKRNDDYGITHSIPSISQTCYVVRSRYTIDDIKYELMMGLTKYERKNLFIYICKDNQNFDFVNFIRKVSIDNFDEEINNNETLSGELKVYIRDLFKNTNNGKKILKIAEDF